MGILNVTPDSFSDGGRWNTPEAAIARGRHLIAEGADIVDIGGESTRPGATRVDAATELARVLPVVEALADDVTVSVDTMRAAVAQAALAAGAQIINDVSGGTADPAMLDVIAQSDVPYICMYHTGPAALTDAPSDPSHAHTPRQPAHDTDFAAALTPTPRHPAGLDRLWRSASQNRPASGNGTPPNLPGYLQTPIQRVVTGLQTRVAALLAAGVQPSQIILDPGLGFAFAGEPNWNILAHLDQLVALGYPVLIGASRKRFLAAASAPWSRYTRLTAGTRPTQTGDDATIAVSTVAAAAGVWAVRVHDVPGNLAAVRTVAALTAAANR